LPEGIELVVKYCSVWGSSF